MMPKIAKALAAVAMSLWLFALHYRGMGLPALDSAIVPAILLIFSVALVFGGIGDE